MASSLIAQSPSPIAAKRPLVVVTERGEEKLVIRHIRFSVDRAVADDDLLRERAIKDGIKKGVAQLEAEGWRFSRVMLDTDNLPACARSSRSGTPAPPSARSSPTSTPGTRPTSTPASPTFPAAGP
jgi:hypothetical protein